MEIKRLNKERYIWLGLLLILLLINFSPLSILSLAYNSSKEEKVYLSVLDEALSHIRSKYIDESKISYKDLLYGAIRGMVNSIKDEHSIFLPEDSYEEFGKNIKGTFHGIGIYITVKDGYPMVIAPIEDTPAYKVGLKPGDKIVEIEGKTTKGINIREAIKRIKGLINTKVSIKVSRKGEIALIPFTITRSLIKVKSVKFKFINKRKGLAYIRITRFSKSTTAELTKVLKYLKQSGMTKLIVDLRNNPGGILEAAYKVCDMFLDEGVIVYTEGRHNKNNKAFYANPKNTIVDMTTPIAVLINGGSASASEIFAGAMQDTKRGIIVGVKSFGKGSVQEIISLRNSKNRVAIKLTTQKYLTPTRRSIHGKGIIPNFIVEATSKKSFDELYDQLYMEGKLSRSKHLSKFLKKYPKHKPHNITNFINNIKKDGIYLDRNTIERLIHIEKNRNKMLIYDLKYDIQLKEAINKIKNQQFDANTIKVFK